MPMSPIEAQVFHSQARNQKRNLEIMRIMKLDLLKINLEIVRNYLFRKIKLQS